MFGSQTGLRFMQGYGTAFIKSYPDPGIFFLLDSNSELHMYRSLLEYKFGSKQWMLQIWIRIILRDPDTHQRLTDQEP